MHDTETRLAAIARALGVSLRASHDDTLAAIAHELGHELTAHTTEEQVTQAELALAARAAKSGTSHNSSIAAKVPRRRSTKGKK